MKLLRAATLSTPIVSDAARRYVEWLDYRVVEEGRVSEALASSWGAPASADRRYAILAPASGADVYLRFVENDPPAAYRPLRSFGWAAIEICVTDVLAVNDRMKASPFEIIGPPREIPGLTAIFPMQVKGPDQEIVYLTQIRDDLPAYDLPRAKTLIDTFFIAVLACSDMAASLRWFESVVGLQAGRAMDIEYTMLAAAFGTPKEQLYSIATMTHGRDVFLELDQYPDAATVRPQVKGALPPGVAVVTLKHPDIDSVKGDWISPPTRRDGPIYGGGRVGVLRDPDGALVEIVEIV
ncbi:MAG: VOC family protein [Parvularculaceae bacterium]|nr:VOC family protein [Parvularculaceae bacterium]